MDDYLGSLKSLITRGMFRAITAHKEIFRDNPNISIALAYLNSATSYFTSAEALYYSNPETYENIFLADVFHCFSVFEKEFLDLDLKMKNFFLDEGLCSSFFSIAFLIW